VQTLANAPYTYPVVCARYWGVVHPDFSLPHIPHAKSPELVVKCTHPVPPPAFTIILSDLTTTIFHPDCCKSFLKNLPLHSCPPPIWSFYPTVAKTIFFFSYFTANFTYFFIFAFLVFTIFYYHIIVVPGYIVIFTKVFTIYLS
jgi:hypothetical protein